MKRIAISVIMLFMITFSGCIGTTTTGSILPTDGPNLIINPGFEQGQYNYPTPGWGIGASPTGNFTPIWDNTIYHSGLRSIKISIPGTVNKRSGYLQSSLMKVTPLQKYNFNIWLKSENLYGTKIWFSIAESNGTSWVNSTNRMLGNGTDFVGTNGWTQRTLTVTSGPKTQYIYIDVLMYSGRGTLWVDDLHLGLNNAVVTPTPIVTTPTPTPTPTATPTVTPTVTVTEHPPTPTETIPTPNSGNILDEIINSIISAIMKLFVSR